MVCKFCKTENVDDAVYCKGCGKRVDGNKDCPVCKKTIAENAVYCNYCGSRTDGKKVCPSCGEVYDGAFCPKCGSSAPVAASAKRVRASETGEITANGVSWKDIVGKVGLSLLLFGVIMALIFVFIIGYGIKVDTNVANNNVDVDDVLENYGLIGKVNIYHYFGKVYENLRIYIDAMGLESYEIDYISPVLYVSAILGTIIAAGALISVVVLSVMATVKIVRKLTGKEAADAEKFAVAAIIAYVLSVALLYALNYASVYTTSLTSYQAQRIKVYATFNGATVAGLVLCAIGLGLGLACYVAKRGSELKNVKGDVLSSLSVVAAVLAVLVASFGSKGIHTMVESSSSGKMQVSLSAVTFLQLWAAQVQSDASLSFGAYIELFILVFLQLALVITAIMTVLRLINGLIKNKEHTALGMNIALTIMAVAYLVLAIIARIEPLDSSNLSSSDNFKITFTPAILTLVFSVLALGVSISKKILNKNQNVDVPATDEQVPAAE